MAVVASVLYSHKYKTSHVEAKTPATWIHSVGLCGDDSYINITRDLYSSI